VTSSGIVNPDDLTFHSLCSKDYNTAPTIPIHAHWDITHGCNFRCTFCLTSSGSRSPDELTTEEGMALIDKLYDAGIFFLKVLGGEPFFRDDTLNLFEYAANKGMILSFSTNASMVTDEVAETLYRLRNSIIYLQMSLYGEDEERYDKVTGSAKNYALALNGLKRMLDKGLDVTILTVATEDNSDRISEYFDVARRFGVKEFRVVPKIGVGRAAKEAEEGTYCQAMVWPNLIKELRKIKNSLKETDPLVRIDARPLLGSYLFNLTGIPYFWTNCISATTMIYIDSTGKAAPCPFLNDVTAPLKKLYSHVIEREDIMDDSFLDVWNSKTFDTFREYHKPEKNLFKINTKCKFYKNKVCTPCVTTPCNCIDLIRSIKKENERLS
jgi:MoaA/NifB/PqqE/SkfB family radical SAM enzyme